MYVAEEQKGIWKYGAEPTAGKTQTQVDRTGKSGNGNLRGDVEGLNIDYAENGTGYPIASSRGSNDVAVYRREGKNEFVGKFKIGSGSGIDEVTSTDGIDVTRANLGEPFSQGVFVAHDHQDPGSRISNLKLGPFEGEVDNAGLQHSRQHCAGLEEKRDAKGT